MKVLICDDMPNETKKLSGLLDSLGYEPIVFTNGADVLEHICAGSPVDVCILDIVMPEMGGIELAKRMREIGFGGEIVFLSTSNEYGPQSYEIKAFHYFVKPPSFENVKRVLDEIKAEQEKNDRSGIKLKVSGSVRLVLFRDVEYTEVIRHHVDFHMSGGEIIEIRAALHEIAPQLLGDNRFIQCHQSYIVNMDAITSITSREILLRSGSRIPVAKSHSDTKMKYLNRSLRGGRGRE